MKNKMTRREVIQAAGMAAVTSAPSPKTTSRRSVSGGQAHQQISQKVASTLFIDTHEHLFEERERLERKAKGEYDDWSVLLMNYINAELIVAGMPQRELSRIASRDLDPVEKWRILEPYWPSVRHTGYGQAVEIAAKKLYDVPRLSASTIKRIEKGYHDWIKPGFYSKMLREVGGIESCQVNRFEAPFYKSDQPDLLIQDISILGMHMLGAMERISGPTGIEVKDLSDWHAVIDWWFKRYANYSAAVKTQAAYNRGLDYEDVPAEKAAPLFKRKISGEELTGEETKAIEDHLFWYCVRKATEYSLPVKIHTGLYAGHSKMPLSRVSGNPASACDICRNAPDTWFVFMHICYPYYEDLVAVAKAYPNAYLDMCWAWIISPVAAVNFLKQYLVTAPANKVFAFGGDYRAIEPVIGHAEIARRGIVQTLSELTEEGWLDLDGALDLAVKIMNTNPRKVFRLDEKASMLSRAPWLGS
jgi:predicted TIM-barrel fold metal-dependent hydrolase